MKLYAVILSFVFCWFGIWGQSTNCAIKCIENEIFTSCSLSQFQPTCWNKHIYFDKTSISCEPGCDCKEGFVRDPNTYKCLSTKNCSKTPRVGICPKNEIWSDCGFRCDKTCRFIENRDFICRSCVEGCVCQKGFVRNTLTGQCVNQKDCDGM